MSKVFKIVLVTFLPLVFISSTLTEKKINEKEAAAIFKKIADWFKDTDKFTVNTEFKTFKSHETITPYETLTGFVKKQGRLFHSYLMGIHTIQNEKYQLMIDTTNKIISVKDAEENIWENINPVIIEKGISASQSIMLDEITDGYKLKLTPTKSSSINSYELQYDKMFRIKNVVLTLTKTELKEDGKTNYQIYPKVNIRFYNYTDGASLRKDDFNLSAFINYSNPEIIPVEKYKSFQLLDLRVKDKIKK